MKTAIFYFLIILVTFMSLYSCQKDNVDSRYPFEAEVLGKNLDCGLYEIKITKGLEKVESIIDLPSPVKGIYIAKNLPKNLETPGVIIVLDLRKPKNNGLEACTDMGPSYPWVYVIRAKRK